MSEAEGLKEILNRLGIVETESEEDRTKQEKYAREYGLLKEPCAYEMKRIEEIKQGEERCRKCRGLRECQYKGGDRGLEGVIIADDLGGKLEGKRLYFGVKECRYLIEAEEEGRIEAMRVESGLPERYKHKRKYDLSAEEREVVKRLQTGETKQLYIKGGRRKSELLLSIIGNEYLRNGQRVRYENAAELLSELRVTSPTYHEKMEAMKRVEVLIIEGLSHEMSRYSDEQTGIILSSRNRRGKRTIVQGVKKLSEMSGMTGEELERFEEVRIE